MADTQGIRPRQRAAMLVRSFSPEIAKQVVSFLSKDERDLLIKEMAMAQNYTTDEINEVAQEYIYEIEGNSTSLMNSGMGFIKDIFEDMPEAELEKMLGRVWFDMENPFDFLTEIQDMEPLLTFLSDEDPQTIAIVSSYLTGKQAAWLIQSLPEDKMIETVHSIAKMDQIDNDLLINISSYLNKKLDTMMTGDSNKADGIKTVVNILNSVDRGTEKTVFERLDLMDKELAIEIKENMFVFEDIVMLDDLSVQKVLKDVESDETLAMAIKGAKEELKDKLFRAMSSNKKEAIEEEIDTMGPKKVSDVDAAQQEIANIAKRLEQSGEIVVVRGDEDVI